MKLGFVVNSKSLNALALAYRLAGAADPRTVNHPKQLQQK
jgi:hypothetical protein